MTKSLRPALCPINSTFNGTTGTLALPPDLFLSTHVMNFVKAWKTCLEESEALNVDNALCVQEFFDKIQALCLKFPAYDHPKNAANIHALCSVIMLYIPWEYLPEEERRERLKIILQNKEFRLRIWQQHLKLMNQRLAQDPTTGLAMDPLVAMALLEHEDLRAELIALPLAQSSVFFRYLPDLIVKMPTLYAELSAEKRQVFLKYQLNHPGTSLHDFIDRVEKQFLSDEKTLSDEHALAMLEPLTKELEVAPSVRARANFVVARIHVARRELAAAKPYVDALTEESQGTSVAKPVEVADYRTLSLEDPLTKANWGLSEAEREDVVGFRHLCAQEKMPEGSAKQLIELLSQLNKSLEVYLVQRDVKGVLYSIGFFNTELSEKKNNLVKILRKDIEGHITNLEKGQYPENSAADLQQKLSAAEQQNQKFQRESARRINLLGIEALQINIDGPGKLGDALRVATASLEQFIPKNAVEPGSPSGSQLIGD